MEDKLIESLLADKALGHLLAESEKLLDEYILDKPEYLELATGFDVTVSTAAMLSLPDDEIVLPEFPRDRMKAIFSKSGNVVFLRRIISMAAVLLVGISILYLISVEHRETGIAIIKTEPVFIQSESQLLDRSSVPGLFDMKVILKRNETRTRVNRNVSVSELFKKYNLKGIL